MNKYPTKFRLSGFDYDILFVQKPREVEIDLERTDLIGQISGQGKRKTITVLVDQQPIGILETLIHEMLHAIFHRTEVLEKSIRPEIGEEAFIDTLATQLSVLLVENKWITLPKNVKPTVKRINE